MNRIAPLALGVLCAGPALADDAWEFRITPYGWAPSFDVTTALPDGGNGSSSGSILDYLAGAFLIAGEARRGKLSFFGDYNYLNLSNNLEFPASLAFNRVRLTGSFGTLAAGYSVFENDGSRVEAFAGARIWSIETKLEGRAIEPGLDTSFTDAIVGLRGETRLSERWGLRGTIDVGGFGLGDSSKLQAEAIAAASYDFTDSIAGVLGYRHLYLDLQNETPPGVDEVTFSGPFVAVDFKF